MEVYDFLRLIAERFEELLRENRRLEDKNRQIEQAIEEYRHMETTLRNTLISSQKIGQEIKEEAERKSNLLIRESELEAERTVHKARRRKEQIEEETFRLLNQHRRFRTEFASLIQAHSDLIKSQDSRLMLEFGGGDSDHASRVLKPEIDSADDEDTEKAEVGEDEIKDLEILFPEEKG
jgi:cell division initiation protein